MTRSESDQQKRERKAEEGTYKRTTYFRMKKLILEKEKENYDKLIFLKTHDDWGYKLFGNSVLLYTDYVAKKLNARPRIVPDRDFAEVSREGTVSFRMDGKIFSSLEEHGIKCIKETDEIKIYQLDKKFTKEEIKAIRESEDMKWAKANELVDVSPVLMPALNQNLKETEKEIYETTRKMQATARDLVGIKMMKNVSNMTEYFMMTMKGKGDVMECLERLEHDTFRLESEMVTVINERLTDVESARRMALQIQKLQTRVQDMIRREKQKMQAAELKKNSKKKVDKK